jgi:hypothetical protein
MDFFKVGHAEDLDKAITRFDIEKFRPLLNFLNSSSQTTGHRNLNMIAALVDFPNRPLSKFLQSADLEIDLPLPVNVSNTLLGPPTAIEHKSRNGRGSQNILIIGLGIIAILIAALIIFKRPSDNCMIWQNDHYISIDCQDKKFDSKMVEPIDSAQVKLKKVFISKRTIFFIKGKPQVWYLKHDGRYEFFNGPGYHPTTKKSLNPVTPYIAMKVVSGELKD